jgi:hypothetical protein
MSTRPFYTLTLAAMAACATAGSGGNITNIHRDPNLINEREIAASNESNAYDVITRLHPVFLKTRGHTTLMAGGSDYASVFLDGQVYGELLSLKNIPAIQIREIRYLSGNQAVTKYGMQYSSGAIDVTTK